MEPSTLAPKKPKPSAVWVLITLAAGAAGALGAITAAGSGTYDIGPFDVKLRAQPAPQGKTELAITAVEDLVPSHAEAGTHAGPIVFRATIVDVDAGAFVAADRIVMRSPHDFASFMAEEGKSAVTQFAIKLVLLAIAGAAAAGAAVSLGRWRRVPGAALAGLLTFAIIGLVVQQTYDKDEFLKTQYVIDTQPGVVPSL